MIGDAREVEDYFDCFRGSNIGDGSSDYILCNHTTNISR